MPPLKESEEKEEVRKASHSWMKYSGMAIQMIVVLLAFVYAGKYLDQWLDTDPWFTMVLSLFGVGSALYVSLKDFL